MEPRLARRLRIVGIQFEQIGLSVEHRGSRAPYQISPRHSQFDLSEDLQHLINDMRSVLGNIDISMKYSSLQANG